MDCGNARLKEWEGLGAYTGVPVLESEEVWWGSSRGGFGEILVIAR